MNDFGQLFGETKFAKSLDCVKSVRTLGINESGADEIQVFVVFNRILYVCPGKNTPHTNSVPGSGIILHGSKFLFYTIKISIPQQGFRSMYTSPEITIVIESLVKYFHTTLTPAFTERAICSPG